MKSCDSCDKRLTEDEAIENINLCNDCSIDTHIFRLAFHVKKKRILAVDLLFKLLKEIK